MVTSPVVADERYVVEVRYSGTPEPVEAPTTREDFTTTGFTITPDRRDVDHAGALRRAHLVPRQRPARPTRRSTTSRSRCRRRGSGVANGDLDRARGRGGHDHDPVAPGRAGGVVPHDRRVRRLHDDLQHLRRAASRSTTGCRATSPASPAGSSRPPTGSTGSRSGSGPTRSTRLGFVLVDSQSGMETQTMITLGKTDYTLSAAGARPRDGAPVVRRPGHARTTGATSG